MRFKKQCGDILMSYTYLLYAHQDKSQLNKWLNNLHRKVLGLFSISTYPVESHHAHHAKYAKSSIFTIKSGRHGYTSECGINLKPDTKQLIAEDLNDIDMIAYRNVAIRGDSDCILDLENKVMINDFCHDMDIRYICMDGAILRSRNNLAMMRSGCDEIEKKIGSGIMISGKFSGNYYHVMYENLIRLLFVDNTNMPDSVPIVIDESTMRIASFRAIYETLAEDCPRDTIVISPQETILFDSLYVLSSVNRITPHFKSIRYALAKDYVFDLDAIAMLRERLLRLKTADKFAKRIFLSRKKTTHRKFNEDEIFRYLEGKGFEMIYIEDYSLPQQISLFNGAEIIVGGSGAAFTNILFCSAGCRIVCLRSHCVNIPIFSTIAHANRCDMVYCCDESNDTSDIHNNYSVSVGMLDKIINQML